MTTPRTEDILIHYGVKGMRWGVRRRRGPGGRVVKSEDKETADALKKRKVETLSNAELRKLNERLQLEQTYSQLMAKENANTRARGARFSQDVIDTTNTIQRVYTFVNSPAGRAIRTAIELRLGLGPGGGRHRA